MTVIGVNPASVHAYGAAAQREFDTVRTQLVGLVQAVAEVRWSGPNAAACKGRAGQLATGYANQLVAGLGAMADIVRGSTTNIAQALGGAPISLHVNGTAIVVPPTAAEDHAEADTAALEVLLGTIDRHLDDVGAALDAHARALAATEWSGNAKEQAVVSVQRFTSTALARGAEARRTLRGVITEQISAVVTADR